MTTKRLFPRPLLKVFLGVFVMTAFVAALLGFGTRAHTSSPAAPAAPARAQSMHPWTAVGSTGVVDESSLNDYAFTASRFGFRTGSTSIRVTARYNVTNTYDNNANANQPGWTTLEFGSVAPPTTSTAARLVEGDPCTGEEVTVCGFSNLGQDGPLCLTCTFSSTRIDFTSKLYYIEVNVARPSGSALLPHLDTLRLY